MRLLVGQNPTNQLAVADRNHVFAKIITFAYTNAVVVRAVVARVVVKEVCWHWCWRVCKVAVECITRWRRRFWC